MGTRAVVLASPGSRSCLSLMHIGVLAVGVSCPQRIGMGEGEVLNGGKKPD